MAYMWVDMGKGPYGAKSEFFMLLGRFNLPLY